MSGCAVGCAYPCVIRMQGSDPTTEAKHVARLPTSSRTTAYSPAVGGRAQKNRKANPTIPRTAETAMLTHIWASREWVAAVAAHSGVRVRLADQPSARATTAVTELRIARTSGICQAGRVSNTPSRYET